MQDNLSIERYNRLVDEILEREFPDYYRKLKYLAPKSKKGLEPLTDSEVLTLWQRYKLTEDIDARNRLIYSQLKLVTFVCRNTFYSLNSTNLSAEDLLGFSNLILVRLIDKYNPYAGLSETDIAKGVIRKFPSFIRRWLSDSLLKEMKNFGQTIRLPHNRINDIVFVKKIISKFENINGRYPYNMEYMDFTTDNINYRCFFNLNKKVIEIYLRVEEELFFHNKVKIHNTCNCVSGDSNDNEGLSFFDTLEGDYNVDMDNTSHLTNLTLQNAINSLEDREREIIKLSILCGTPMNEISRLIEPNLNDKREVERLRVTSLNFVTLYFNNGENFTYNVTCNNHLLEHGSGEIISPNFTSISHKYMTISTKTKNDKFIIKSLNLDKVVHKTCKGEKQIQYTENKDKIEFEINYHCGEIFTSQTGSNKEGKILSKLRKKMLTLDDKH